MNNSQKLQLKVYRLNLPLLSEFTSDLTENQEFLFFSLIKEKYNYDFSNSVNYIRYNTPNQLYLAIADDLDNLLAQAKLGAFL